MQYWSLSSDAITTSILAFFSMLLSCGNKNAQKEVTDILYEKPDLVFEMYKVLSDVSSALLNERWCN